MLAFDELNFKIKICGLISNEKILHWSQNNHLQIPIRPKKIKENRCTYQGIKELIIL